MPYIPDLIPKENRVLPEYFSALNPKGKEGKSRPQPLAVIAAIVFFIGAVHFYHYFFIALCLTLAGIICTGPGKRRLEKIGSFSLTQRIRLLFCAILVLCCIPLWPYYLQVDADAADARLEAVRKAKEFTADSLKKENSRRDSLASYLAVAKQPPSKTVILKLKYAEKFALTDADHKQLRDALDHLNLQYITNLLQRRQFDDAMPMIGDELKDEPDDPQLLYDRALCYLNDQNVVLAVNDLDSAISHGMKSADKLYNKINPLRKRIVAYETLCSDGSTSDATGRGACSWHGGVAEWNHPIYETSRKYGNRQDNP